MGRNDALNILYVEGNHCIDAENPAPRTDDGEGTIWNFTESGGLPAEGLERFDVIVIEPTLDDAEGLEIARQLRARGLTTPVLMLAAGARDKAAANDLAASPFEASELLDRIKVLYHRSSLREDSSAIFYGRFECHLKARTAFRQNRYLPLSQREFALFRYLMENAGEIVTREMLLRDVWGMTFDPQTNVVDVNIGRLRRKLDDGFASPALETIWGSGYRLLQG